MSEIQSTASSNSASSWNNSSSTSKNHPFRKATKFTTDLVQNTGKAVAQGIQTTTKPLNGLTEKSKNVIARTFQLNGTSFSSSESSPDAVQTSTAERPALRDEILSSRMKLILRGDLECSLDDYVNNYWQNKEFYQSFLEDGAKNINVGPWQEGEWKSSWDEQTYPLQSKVTLEVQQQTPVYTGTVFIKQTLFCHQNKEDSENPSVVVAIQNETSGVPFADTFNVQIRWVATQISTSRTHVQVGLFVYFVKSCIISGTIRSAASKETTLAHQTLLQRIQSDLGQDMTTANVLQPGEDGAVTTSNPVQVFFQNIMSCFHSEPVSDSEKRLQKIEKIFHKIQKLPVGQDKDKIHEFFEIAAEALNTIIARHMKLDQKVKLDDTNQTPNSSLVILKPVKTFASDLQKTFEQLTPRPVSFSFLQSKTNKTKDHDDCLSGMNVIISQTITGTSMEILRQSVVVEESKRREWLEDCGFKNIDIGQWAKASPIKPFIEEWSGEAFDYKRKSSYEYPNPFLSLTKSLSGSTVRQLNEELYRVENDRDLVVASKHVFSGTAFSKMYEVYTRHLFQEQKDGKLSVRVGIHVLFKGTTLAESHIRASVTHEFTKRIKKFFENLQGAIDSFREVDMLIDEKLMEEFTEQNESPLSVCAHHLQSIGSLLESPDSLKRDPDLGKYVEKIGKRLGAIEQFLRSNDDQKLEDINFYESQLEIVGLTLKRVLELQLGVQ